MKFKFSVAQAIAFLLFFTSVQTVFAKGGTKDGGGGGGVVQNGQYLTLGEAKAVIPFVAMADLPQAESLLETKIKLMPLPNDVVREFTLAVLPLGKRKYYDLRDGSVDPRFRAELVNEYRKLVKDKDLRAQITIYAFTKDQTTYLLPEFFNLSNDQQEVILFHEALWALGKKSNYEKIVRAEILFERLVKSNTVNQFHGELYATLASILDRPFLPLISAGIADAEKKGQASTVISVEKLFKGFTYRYFGYDPKYSRYLEVKAEDKSEFEKHMTNLVLANQDSDFYQELYNIHRKVTLIFTCGLCTSAGAPNYIDEMVRTGELKFSRESASVSEKGRNVIPTLNIETFVYGYLITK